MNSLPPLGPQNTESSTIRQVETNPVKRGLFSRWIVKFVDAISHLFGFSSPFSHPSSRPAATSIDERSTSVPRMVDTPSVIKPEKKAVDQPVVQKRSQSFAEKPQPEAVPKDESSRFESLQQKTARKKPVKKESRNARLRRKKHERKERRLEAKRKQYLNEGPKSTAIGSTEPLVKSHKMERTERKAAGKGEQHAIAQMMAIDYLTEDELSVQESQRTDRNSRKESHRAEQVSRQEFARLSAIDTNFDSSMVATSQGATSQGSTSQGSTSQDVAEPGARAVRIPNEDMPAMVNTAVGDYQQTVARLFNRLQQEKDDQGQAVLSSASEFQACFAPLIADPELDIEEAVTAFVHFKKLQTIQSMVDGAHFPDVAFALLFEEGGLENDPLAFEDVIGSTADLEPGFKTIAENNAFHRNEQYRDLVSYLFEGIEEQLVERQAALQRVIVPSGVAGDFIDADLKPEAESIVTPGQVEENEEDITDRLHAAANLLGSQVPDKGRGFERQDTGYDSGVDMNDDD